MGSGGVFARRASWGVRGLPPGSLTIYLPLHAPCWHRARPAGEFECYPEYTAVANGAPVRRADVSMAGATHGVELSLLEGTLVGVSLYLE